MKIAISATGRDVESNLNKTFGRAPFFLIVDTKTQDKKVVINKVKDHQTGVGIVVDNIIANEEIDAVITFDIGPFAYETLEQCGIRMYHAEGRIKDAIQQLKEGKLSEITKPTVSKYTGLKQKKIE